MVRSQIRLLSTLAPPRRRHDEAMLVDPSLLTPNELSNLLWILDALDDTAARQCLRDQVDTIAVANRQAMHTNLITSPGCVAANVADGPLAVRAAAYDGAGTPIGFVSVWVEGGRLSCISLGWVTDDMPSDFPPAESLQLLDRSD